MRYGMRQVQAPDFSVGGRRDVRLEKESLLRQLTLRTAYTFGTAGGTGVGTIYGDAAYRLARQIQLFAGQRPIHNVDGRALGKIVKLFFPEEYAQTNPANLTASSSHSCVSEIPIPFFMFQSLVEEQFALPTMADGVFRLVVDWGVAQDLAKGNDGTVSISAATTELYETPIYGVDPRPFSKWAGLRLSTYRKDVTQTGKITIQLEDMEPGIEIRALLIEGLAGGSGGTGFDPNNSVISDIAFRINGRDEYEQVRASVIQNRNKVQYQLSSLETGVYVLDAAENWRTERGQLWTVGAGEQPVLTFNVAKQSGDNEVVVTAISAVRAS